MNNKPTIITVSNFNGHETDYLIQADASIEILKTQDENGRIIGLSINVDSESNPKGILEVKGR